MNNLMKPIIYGALIIAAAIFLGAQRIAYVVSFEGRWDSCVKTLQTKAHVASSIAAENMCFVMMQRGNLN